MSEISIVTNGLYSGRSGLFTLDCLRALLNSKFVISSPPAVNIFYNCYLVKTKNGFRVFDKNLNPISVSLTYRGGAGYRSIPVIREKDKLAYVEICSPRGSNTKKWVEWSELPNLKNKLCTKKIDSLFFMLPLHNEFGHALTGGLSRFWPLVFGGLPDVQFVFNGVYSDKNKEIAKVFWKAFGQEDSFEAKNLGSNNHLCVFKVDKIYIPEPGLHLCGVYNEVMGDVWESIVASCVPSRSTQKSGEAQKRIYLSRRKVGKRVCLDEDVLESIFIKNGFEVVFPEMLSFEEQVFLVNKSDVVAGLSGSALHLSQFMKERSKLIALTPVGHVMPDLAPVSKIKNIDLLYLIGGDADTAKYSKDAEFEFLDAACTSDFVSKKIKSFIEE